jgi:hypothetical protein
VYDELILIIFLIHATPAVNCESIKQGTEQNRILKPEKY